ncbi:hypothetical protein ACVWZR_000933 [Bradyrhizobium sp. i1.3.1]
MNASAKELAANFDLEKLTPEFYDDPYPTYRALRDNEPVKRLPNGTVFLTRYDDLVTTYKNTKSFSSDKKREFAPKYGDTPLYEHHTTSLVFNDPPAHTRVRRLIMGALSPRAIAGMEPDIVKLVDWPARCHRRQGDLRADRRLRRVDPHRSDRQSARRSPRRTRAAARLVTGDPRCARARGVARSGCARQQGGEGLPHLSRNPGRAQAPKARQSRA